MKKIFVFVLSLCMALALFAGCNSNNPEDPPEDASASTETEVTAEPEPEAETGLVIRDAYLKDRIVIGVNGDTSSLVPWGRAVFGNAEARNLIFQKLLRGDTDGETRLEMVRELKQIDPLTYELTLWDNIKDSNGNSFTSSDVVYSVEQYVGTGNRGGVSKLADLPEGQTNSAGGVLNLEIVDEYTLIWHNSAPFNLGELARQMANANMVTQASFEAAANGMATDPVGTGPYKLKSINPGSGAVLEADEDFWMKDIPEDVRRDLWVYCYQNIKEIEYQAIRDASTRAIALEMGTIDCADGIDAIDLENFESNPDISPVFMLNRPPLEMIFNCSDTSLCADINLRMAICYAIDNAAISEGIGTYTFPVYGFQPNLADSDPSWKEGREYYNADKAKAAELVEKSSYNGKPLNLMYGTSVTGVSFETVAVLIQAQLKEVGINIEIKSVEQAVNEVDRFDEKAWDLRMDTWGGGDYYVDTFKSFNSNAYPEDLKGRTLMLVEDPELESLFAAMDENPTAANIKAYDDYFTFDKCYGYGIVGWYLQTAARTGTNVALGERGTLIVPGAFTFERS
jgi:ABC-type transport system substrate-binding protein